MDEPMRKSGQWPNVAIPAGSDPWQVMEHYGVMPCMEDDPVQIFMHLLDQARKVDNERDR